MNILIKPFTSEYAKAVLKLQQECMYENTAFALFTDFERTPDKWRLNKQLYSVALKAVDTDRSKRQQSIRQFRDEWNQAKTID
jgi:uncharacterized phage-like protein YoqJ